MGDPTTAAEAEVAVESVDWAADSSAAPGPTGEAGRTSGGEDGGLSSSTDEETGDPGGVVAFRRWSSSAVAAPLPRPPVLSTLAERRECVPWCSTGDPEGGVPAAMATTTSPWFCSNMVLEGARVAINEWRGQWREGGDLSAAPVTG